MKRPFSKEGGCVVLAAYGVMVECRVTGLGKGNVLASLRGRTCIWYPLPYIQRRKGSVPPECLSVSLCLKEYS